MKLLKVNTFILLLILSTGSLKAQLKQLSVLSPDKHINLKLSIKNNKVSYSISRDSNTVIEPSDMGLVINKQNIGTALGFGKSTSRIVNETYAWRGVHSKAVDYCTETHIAVTGGSERKSFNLEARVYNNGVAFRYLISAKGNNEISEDLTTFTIPAGSTVWSQDDIGNYEGTYRQQDIDEVKNGQLIGPPATIKLPGTIGYAAITEGGVTNFAGMSLKASASRTFKANLKGSTNLNGNIATPWRIIEIGKDLNTLVNCDIIANVSPKPDKKLFPQGFATPWVKPGKSVWSWLTGNRSVTLENMKRFSKWAGELGITYNLVDDGWAAWQDGKRDKWDMLKELINYSNQQNVKVWVWKAYPELNGIPGLKDPKYRHEFFKQCKDAGVAGLKIDFFDNEAQEVMNFYQEALKDAAELHLMLDFHGADKPTGQSRTWPNEMTREGIRGLEAETNWPKHNTTLVFTRFLAGHADYTPLSFSSIVKGTTLTHQVATVAAFTSPFMCLAVEPEALLNSVVKPIVKNLPVVWDETVVLPQSKIGELALLARRSGTKWYLAAINGDKAQQLNLNLSFLGKGNYQVTSIQDTDNDSSQAKLQKATVKQSGHLTLNMANGGGFVAVFEK